MIRMNRKKSIWLSLFLSVLWLTAGAVWATGSNGGEGTGNSAEGTGSRGRTDVMAGVVVDYMGKVRFEVLDKKDNTPIAGASVELYIPALDRYVLFGMSDENGSFEMEAAYNRDPDRNEADQFTGEDGKTVLPGGLLYLDSSQIRYQVYKADWLPYPNQGSFKLDLTSLPQVVTVYLYQKEVEPTTEAPTTEEPTTTAPTEAPTEPTTPEPTTKGGGEDPKPPTPTTTIPDKPSPSARGQQLGGVINNMIEVINDVMVPLGDKYTEGIPKTGVEGAVRFWMTGMLLFLAAGLCGWRLLRQERNDGKRKE